MALNIFKKKKSKDKKEELKDIKA
ncbi:hypothetical protein PRSY57_1329800, partial [Plasmodium reichenowi]